MGILWARCVSTELKRLRALALERSPAHVHVLVAALSHRDVDIRCLAVRGLGWLRREDYAHHIASALADASQTFGAGRRLVSHSQGVAPM